MPLLTAVKRTSAQVDDIQMYESSAGQTSTLAAHHTDPGHSPIRQITPCKKNMYQIGMFSLCYMSWVFVHMQREFWAMSKEVILEENPALPKTYFGWINTSLFLTYALCQMFTGAIGDAFAKKYVLAISFTLQAVLFVVVGLVGKKNHESMEGQLITMCLLFGLIGLI
jgi:sugar phosphate permease